MYLSSIPVHNNATVINNELRMNTDKLKQHIETLYKIFSKEKIMPFRMASSDRNTVEIKSNDGSLCVFQHKGLNGSKEIIFYSFFIPFFRTILNDIDSYIEELIPKETYPSYKKKEIQKIHNEIFSFVRNKNNETFKELKEAEFFFRNGMQWDDTDNKIEDFNSFTVGATKGRIDKITNDLEGVYKEKLKTFHTRKKWNTIIKSFLSILFVIMRIPRHS